MAQETLVKGLTILDPTTRPEAVAFAMAPRLDTLNGKMLGVLDNSKPNAGRILDLVVDELAKSYKLAGVVKKRKSDASRPATQEMLDELAEHCQAVVVGVGD